MTHPRTKSPKRIEDYETSIQLLWYLAMASVALLIALT